MSALIPVGSNDYIINFGHKYRGKRLSWAVQHRSYWLIEYVMTAYPETNDVVWEALKKREKEINSIKRKEPAASVGGTEGGKCKGRL
jgi:hypothetical protein